MSLDRIRGLLIGAFMGDALGAPKEFRENAKTPYSGILDTAAQHTSRFQGKRQLAVGQVTDDSEMMLALIRQLIADRGYQREHVIQAYLNWANSGGWMMGKNTRELLRGVKTLKGYTSRMAKVLALPEAERSQSNGAMMRCAPLALIWDNGPAVADVNITNPNRVCQDCNLVYLTALRYALLGYSGPVIFEQVRPLATTTEVQEVIQQVATRTVRNTSDKKGWCLHALWYALITITSFTNYAEAMRWVILSQDHTDTDTNACIAGALLGTILGFEALQKEEMTAYNIKILLSVNTATGPTPRPDAYSPRDFYQLSQQLHEIFGR